MSKPKRLCRIAWKSPTGACGGGAWVGASECEKVVVLSVKRLNDKHPGWQHWVEYSDTSKHKCGETWDGEQ